jgi:hypothetical protein
VSDVIVEPPLELLLLLEPPLPLEPLLPPEVPPLELPPAPLPPVTPVIDWSPLLEPLEPLSTDPPPEALGSEPWGNPPPPGAPALQAKTETARQPTPIRDRVVFMGTLRGIFRGTTCEALERLLINLLFEGTYGAVRAALFASKPHDKRVSRYCLLLQIDNNVF